MTTDAGLGLTGIYDAQLAQTRAGLYSVAHYPSHWASLRNALVSASAYIAIRESTDEARKVSQELAAHADEISHMIRAAGL